MMFLLWNDEFLLLQARAGLGYLTRLGRPVLFQHSVCATRELNRKTGRTGTRKTRATCPSRRRLERTGEHRFRT